MRLFFVLFLLNFFILPRAKAQETLPGFSASLKSNGKILISWRNTYPSVNQISIQRSSDSLHNFITLLTVPDPRIPENGFVDTKSSGTKMYYRIFILFANSKYLFTKSKRATRESDDADFAESIPAVKEKPTPVNQPDITVQKPATVSPEKQPSVSTKQPSSPSEKQTALPAEKQKLLPAVPATAPAVGIPATKTEKPAVEEDKYLILPKIDNSRIYYLVETPNMTKPTVNNPGKIKELTIEVDKILYVKRRDSVIMLLPGKQVRRFSDSLVKQTKDTLFFVNADTLQIKPFVEPYHEAKEVYKISAYVYTSKDGNVTVSLPDYLHKKYFVAFYEMDSTQVMTVKDIKDAELIIDKTNFGHSGWFRFELYEDGRLKEKNKFLIPRD
jgi:hypothetical protein